MEFKYYWLCLKRHWFTASSAFFIVLLLSALGFFLQKPTYKAQGELLFRKVGASSTLTGLGQGLGVLEPLQSQNNPVESEAEIIRSFPITKDVIAQANLRDKNGKSLKEKIFLKLLEVRPVRGTDALVIAYIDKDPNKAAEVVNLTMSIYLEKTSAAYRSEITDTCNFIQNELFKTKTDVLQADFNLRKFKEDNKIVSLKQELESSTLILIDLKKRLADAQSQYDDANAQFEVFQKELGRNPKQAMMMSSLSQSHGVQEVLQKIQQLESQLTIEHSRIQERNPKITSLKDELSELHKLLYKRIAIVIGNKVKNYNGDLQLGQTQQDFSRELVRLLAQRLSLTSKINTLSNRLDNYSQRVNLLPKLEQEERGLERQLETSQSTYLNLSQKLQELKVTENQNIGNAKIISLAQKPDEPDSPSKVVYLAGGILLGSFAAVSTALALEARNNQ